MTSKNSIGLWSCKGGLSIDQRLVVDLPAACGAAAQKVRAKALAAP